MPDDLTSRGIVALEAGDRLRVHQLAAAVTANPNDEQAWLWLSGVVDSDDDRAVALENVLVINPGNEWAKRGLQLMGRPLPGESK